MKNITLLAVSSIKLPETITSLVRCFNVFEFKEIKLVSHERPSNLPNIVQYESCPRLKNINDYNEYMFKELGRHVSTEHCLIVQYDSWILRPNIWDDSWLEYDYIGAPWPVKEDAYKTFSGETVRVGNGGFSLRSKRLLELPNELNLPLLQDRGYYNEDGNICVYHRDTFEAHGIKYAPVEVAARFSFETDVPENQGIDTFGFHRNIR